MKRKLIVFVLIFVIIIAAAVSGLMFMKKKHNVFYKSHFGILDEIFKDRNVLRNYQRYREAENSKNKLWNYYYNASLKKNTVSPLKTPTYDGSGQANHPDMLYFKEGFRGKKYWLAYTPYASSDQKLENPSILVSDDGLNFTVLDGRKNPIAGPPSDVNEGGHFSDTDILFSNGNIELYYVYNKKGVPGPSKFFRVKSRDGLVWSKPELLYQSTETVEGYSPAVIKEGNNTKMWYVGGEGNFVFTQSLNDGKDWSKIERCQINLEKWRPWHVDIIKTDKGYEGLLCAKSTELDTRALFYINSTDGVKWNAAPRPLLFPKRGSWDSEEIYRSTLLKDGDKYRIWYSARGRNEKWHIGYTEATSSEIDNLKQGF